MSTANGCRHRGKGDGTRALPERQQRRGGRGEETPFELESLGGNDEEEHEDREEREVTPPPQSPP
jgi:hypothetical protein